MPAVPALDAGGTHRVDEHPDPRRPQARRRPFRLRPVQGPPRGAGRAGRAAAPRCSAPRTARPRSRTWSGGCARAWRELFSLPEGYEVVLGNGGSTAFWDIAAFGLIREKSQHLQLRRVLRRSSPPPPRPPPWLADPQVIKAEPGTHPLPRGRGRRRRLRADPQRDLHRRGDADRAARPAPTRTRWCWSTRPPAPAACRSTSPRPTSTTSPRRSASPPTAACGSACSPRRALARVAEIAGSGRYIPTFFDLPTAIDNSSKDQTYNTPAVATLFLLAEQLDWLNGNGGLDWAVGAHRATPPPGSTPGPRSPSTRRRSSRTRRSARRSSAPSTSPTRSTRPRSPRRCAPTASSTPSPYRKLGRNQLRIAMFPAIDPADVEALTACIDYVVERF